MSRRKTSKTYHVIFTMITERGEIKMGYVRIFEGPLRAAAAYCQIIDEHYSSAAEFTLSISKIARSFRGRKDAYEFLKRYGKELSGMGV